MSERTLDQLARAELSYSKVRAITRVDDIEREDGLVELAHHATAAQLERLVRPYRRVVGTEEGARAQLENRYLKLDWDEDGCLRIQGRLPAEQGALLLKAVESVWDAVGENVSAETRIQPYERMDLGLAIDAMLDFAPPGGTGSRGRDPAARAPEVIAEF